MLAWVELYYQQRCRRIVDLPKKDSENDETKSSFKPSHHVELAVKIFNAVDKLLEEDGNMTPGQTTQVCEQISSRHVERRHLIICILRTIRRRKSKLLR